MFRENEVDVKTVAARVLDMQDAVNLVGIAADMPLVRAAVLAETVARGTFARNRHPLMVLYIYKLAALAGFEDADFGLSETFRSAELEVRRLAGRA